MFGVKTGKYVALNVRIGSSSTASVMLTSSFDAGVMCVHLGTSRHPSSLHIHGPTLTSLSIINQDFYTEEIHVRKLTFVFCPSIALRVRARLAVVAFHTASQL